MKKTFSIVLAGSLVAVFVTLMTSGSLVAQQPIQAISILSRFLNDNHEHFKAMYRLSHNMQREAQPFTSPRHRERFRFQPNDNNPREIMITARKANSRFKMISGMLSRSAIANREMMFAEIYESLDSIDTFSKRAIRAIRDNNYALYLASAKGIEQEVAALNYMLHDLQLAINDNIYEIDASRESL